MVVLDTNVLSELMRPNPSKQVEMWVDSHPDSYITAITQAEILYGLELLPSGSRRRAFFAAADKTFQQDFVGRILAFDSEAAVIFAAVAAARRRRGCPISQADGQIASIATAHGASFATRNTRDFEHCGLKLVNPWQDA